MKAAFLFNFTQFVEWPADAFAADDEPLRLCLLGGDPFAGALDTIVAGERSAGRRLEVRRLHDAGDAAGCHLLFLPRDADPEQLDRALRAAGADRTLSVGETSVFLRHGGLIRFRVTGGRVRLEVNRRALAASRLKISSKLLRLAEIVEPGGDR